MLFALFSRNDMDSLKAWQEKIYWNYFNFSRFTLHLPPDFLQRLKLPRKFVDYMGTRLPEKVVLQVSGAKWHIPLQRDEEGVAFHGEEWQEFAKAYSLSLADILVFKYNRNECFEVLVFDCANSCEKEASYFVESSQHPKCSYNHSNGEGEENFSNVLQDRNRKRAYASNEETRIRPTKITFKSPKNNSFEGFTDESQEGNDDAHNNSRNRSWSAARASLKDCSSEELTDGSQGKDDSGCGKYINGSAAKKSTGRTAQCYQSNRRPVTEAAIRMALEMAEALSAKYHDSFFVVMRQTCVNTPFTVTIPMEWKQTKVINHGDLILLRIKEKTWQCRYRCTVNNGGFGRGWKAFALENSLEEHDVCLFVPNGQKDGMPILDVGVFRVLPDAVPPSLLSP